MLFRICLYILLSVCLIPPAGALAAENPAPASAAQKSALAKLRLCVVEENPPFAFWNDKNELEGFNVDMWNAMNIPYAFIYRKTDFPTALAAVQGGYCHMVLTNISITPERSQRFVLSEPYLHSSLGIMLRGADTETLKVGDLQGKTIAVLKGSTSEYFVMEKLKDGEILALNSEERLFEALLEDYADAIICDLPIMQRFASHAGRGLVRILDTQLTPQAYAYGFAKGQNALRDSVNVAIQRLQGNGTIASLYEKWFGAAPQKMTPAP